MEYKTLATYKESVQCKNTFGMDFKGRYEGSAVGNMCTGYVLIDRPANVKAC